MQVMYETSYDRKNEKYAGVTYPLPPKTLNKTEIEDKRLFYKKLFGKNLIVTFFNKGERKLLKKL